MSLIDKLIDIVEAKANQRNVDEPEGEKGTLKDSRGNTWGPKKGLEGPFRYRSGVVLYYDPREGAYYDPIDDAYLPKDGKEFRAMTHGRPVHEAKAEPGDRKAILAKLAKKLYKMTDENDHTGAVVALAEFVGNTPMIQAAKAIESIHDAFGSMPSPAIELRTVIRDELFRIMAKLYTAEEIGKLKASF